VRRLVNNPRSLSCKGSFATTFLVELCNLKDDATPVESSLSVCFPQRFAQHFGSLHFPFNSPRWDRFRVSPSFAISLVLTCPPPPLYDLEARSQPFPNLRHTFFVPSLMVPPSPVAPPLPLFVLIRYISPKRSLKSSLAKTPSVPPPRATSFFHGCH